MKFLSKSLRFRFDQREHSAKKKENYWEISKYKLDKLMKNSLNIQKSSKKISNMPISFYSS